MSKAENEFRLMVLLSKYSRKLVEDVDDIRDWVLREGSVVGGILFTLAKYADDRDFGEIVVLLTGRTDVTGIKILEVTKEKDSEFHLMLIAGEALGICPGLFSAIRSIVDGFERTGT
jgi:hypothetical protein